MLRRTKIVIAIAFMVTILSGSFSYLYLSEILSEEVANAHDNASHVASDLAYLATSAAPDLTSTHTDTNNPKAVRKALAYYLGTDADLNAMLESVVGNWPAIYDAALVDADGKVILDTNPDLVGKQIADRPNFHQVFTAGFRRQLRLIYNAPSVYDVRQPLQLNGDNFGSIRVGVSTVLVRNALTPRLRHALVISIIAIFASVIIAAALSNIALGPLERLSRSLDNVTSGDGDTLEESHAGKDEYGLVTLKIAHLGRQMRDARQIFSALKDNVDQIMANLQDGLMLFTRDTRVVLVSASVERFLGRSRRELLGRTAKDIFQSDSAFGALLLDSFHLHHPIDQREVEAPNAKRVKISLDFISERGTQIGALLTMRDAESARRIENEIELSRRMSASGRLTRGVAHEVKNPINAIVLHLQLLQSKLKQIDPGARRHIDIIDSEIHRLDRVVQILVDFTRPRDLRMEDVDLRRILEDVAALAAPDAEQHGVKLLRAFTDIPLPVRIDTDAIKQAVLNVVLNGIQAMPQGGVLRISAERDRDSVVTQISDQGPGIPPEVQDKIFELYFSTKENGSGIGLASTYQVMQWHHGAVNFESLPGQGTTFTLSLPLASLDEARSNIIPPTVSEEKLVL